MIALVVALAAGGTVYALMSGGDGNTAGGNPSGRPTDGTFQGTAPLVRREVLDRDGRNGRRRRDGPAARRRGDPDRVSAARSTTIDNASGLHSRRLTIQQGGAGDTVMSPSPTDPPATAPTTARSRATSPARFRRQAGDRPDHRDGRPAAERRTPRAASTVTLLPDGSLKRVNTGSGEQLTYRRTDTGHCTHRTDAPGQRPARSPSSNVRRTSPHDARPPHRYGLRWPPDPACGSGGDVVDEWLSAENLVAVATAMPAVAASVVVVWYERRVPRRKRIGYRVQLETPIGDGRRPPCPGPVPAPLWC
ncbi:hypothetical protein SHIRM173S_08337 [Streptomyces hirsutus]